MDGNKMSEENHTEQDKTDILLDETDVSEQTEALVEPVIENNTEKYLIYGVNDAPPIHITIICALQQSLLSLSGQLIVSLLVAEAVCASDNNVFKAKLLSSTLFMSGITTVAMNLFGIRLPLYQGASASYIIPLLLVANTDGNFCTSESENLLYNATDNTTSQDFPMEKILFNVRAILISICINWIICAILTKFDVIPNNPDNPGFNARTDARADIILNNPWVSVPYPGQYGAFGFSAAAFLSFMIATVMSILDSIGDYYACAKVARVPAPPKHAVNRGILIEGVCSFLSGSVGCGHATSTYGGNIGAIGVTKVASRRVFICTGIFYILFGIFGKFSAVFITIPYPVLGGAIVVMFGIFFGVVISNLEVTNMSSPRNMAIIGLSIFIGLAVPTWAQKESSPVSTGYEQFDKIMSMLLGNPNLTGTLIACFLDNTVPGSLEDRGIATWQVTDDDEDGVVDKTKYNEGYDVYTPLLPQRLLRSRIMRFIPFLPYRKTKLNHNGV
ncbi:solute carrier family 23 member 2-like isoform X2 [Mercenaria mercenaria]|uniref:solute carrier family 23 member 2-like isoform X2 n=1 Tax=Mercenaria mercenaria TaxID=6596 RepID=UPI00234F93A0|nr:solute carrier family 23 member 2-like isoform X2 [Mercenaria mercenaria]